MKCPVCNIALTMSERRGIEIDYCPQCRGVWLDRGALDKMIEKSAAVPQRDNRERQEPYRDYREKEDYYKHKPHKRKSFLSELFDLHFANSIISIISIIGCRAAGAEWRPDVP